MSLEELKHETRYDIRMNVRYHARRARFFDTLSRCTRAIAILAASGAGLSGFAEEGVASVVLGMLAVLMTTMEWSFDFSQKSALHKQLQRDYVRLDEDFVTRYGELTQGDCYAMQARISALQLDEPAHLSALVRSVQNEIAIADGHPDFIKPLTNWQCMSMHFFDHSLIKNPKRPRKGTGTESEGKGATK